MADHAEDDFDGDIFIYRGGRAPQHISHARIDESVDEIEDNAFGDCKHLVHVETHDSIRRIGKWAFDNCTSLPWIDIKSVVEIDKLAFYNNKNLESVEFGDRLETIGQNAFLGCASLERLKLPSIITIGKSAFDYCIHLVDAELSERLETIEVNAFHRCDDLKRIAIPLKRDLFSFNNILRLYNQFDGCEDLITVDLVGGIHETVASLHMESWRTELFAEINRINQVLPGKYDYEKTDTISLWIEPLFDKLDHYKYEHNRYVKEGTILLELALWKAKLGEKEECSVDLRRENLRRPR